LETSAPEKQLGLFALTAIVVGNMIGSGIFLLPSDLARIGSISLFSWIITTFGAFALAIVFSKMSLLIPKSGGPYAYAQAGFGDFIGFQTAYNYSIALIVGNAAVAVAMVGYLTTFWPTLNTPTLACLIGITAVWLQTLVNIFGMRYVGIMAIITTILKLIPILLIAILGWWYFHPSYIVESFNTSGTSNFHAVTTATTLTLWAFIGVESAAIPSGSVINPSRNIPLATLIGTMIAAIVYISVSTAIMGIIPATILAKSTSPFAAVAGVMFGKWGNWIIAAGAAISCFGALNGWVLLQGQVPKAAAQDNLMPKIFAKKNKAGVPAWGLVITSTLVSIFLLMTSNPDLVKQFQFIIVICALVSLLPYLYTAIAQLIILDYAIESKAKIILYITVALIAAAYSCFAIFGTGKDVLFYGSFVIFSSIPLYALVCWQKRRNNYEL
jgi:APA family basic amino acid/polyamine antiporter